MFWEEKNKKEKTKKEKRQKMPSSKTRVG